MLKTTKQHTEYWKNRDIDWKLAYCNPDNPADTIFHPHRNLIINALTHIRFNNLLEIGCASGANLYRVAYHFPKVRVGGVDVSSKAIETARKFLPPNAVLDVASVENMYFNDKSADVVLTDMTLIYIDPSTIKKVLKEIARITRSNLILCEFYSPSWLERFKLRWRTGYNAHNYKKLLKKAGFYDIIVEKIGEKDWPGGNPQKDFGYIITAKI